MLLGAPWGALGALLEASWGPLEGLLEASWGPLGSLWSWGPLEGLLGGLLEGLSKSVKTIRFLTSEANFCCKNLIVL